MRRLVRPWLASLKRTSQTFHFRLAIWNAAVVILTAVVTLIVLRQGVRWAILHEIDQILNEDADEIALAVAELEPYQFDALREDLRRKAVGHRRHGWFVQLRDAHNDVIWASSEAPEARPPAPQHLRRSAQAHAGFRSVDRRLPPGSHRIATVRVGTSMRFLREDMGRIDQMVLYAAGLVLLLAPATGYWLAGRAVRPISDVTHTAARLRPTHLDERLPVRGTGDELDRLAWTVNGLLDRIGTYLQEKRDFLANAAHELRTPLAAIRSSVEVALGSDRTKDEYEELLVEIIDQGLSLEMLVNQLLLISEAEAERLKSDYTLVALDEVVARATDMFQGVAESRGVLLQVGTKDSVEIRGNRNLLRQLVNNLIDNAIKYTPSGGNVTVELRQNEQTGGAVMTVADTGIGIAPGDIPHVFDRFFRAERSRSRVKDAVGTGLGLSICEVVTTAHGGSIQCESMPGSGTTMTVWLPANGEETVPIDAAAAHARASRPHCTRINGSSAQSQPALSSGRLRSPG